MNHPDPHDPDVTVIASVSGGKDSTALKPPADVRETVMAARDKTLARCLPRMEKALDQAHSGGRQDIRVDVAAGVARRLVNEVSAEILNAASAAQPEPPADVRELARHVAVRFYFTPDETPEPCDSVRALTEYLVPALSAAEQRGRDAERERCLADVEAQRSPEGPRERYWEGYEHALDCVRDAIATGQPREGTERKKGAAPTPARG